VDSVSHKLRNRLHHDNSINNLVCAVTSFLGADRTR
jgi:hypothetical protein